MSCSPFDLRDYFLKELPEADRRQVAIQGLPNGLHSRVIGAGNRHLLLPPQGMIVSVMVRANSF